jgi:arylsulfatase A-like enzyme
LRKAGYRTSLFGKWHLGKPPSFGLSRAATTASSGCTAATRSTSGTAKDDPSPLIDGERILTDHGF